MVILGGVVRIANVAGVLMPFMAAAYILIAMTILIANYHAIPHAFASIFHDAFFGNAVLGGGIGMVIRYGVARGVFSNEAGLGSAAIIHASAKTTEPVRQGLIAMLGPFIDTILICTMTGLVIVITGVWAPHATDGHAGAALSAYAFDKGFLFTGNGQLGGIFVGVSLVFFAYTTMITWSYYGDRCATFLWGEKKRALLSHHFLPLGCRWCSCAT